MTPAEILSELTAANIPNPRCRLDDNNGRYRVTAETEINGQHYSHGMIVHLWVTPKELERTIEKFKQWHVELNDVKGHE